MYIHVHVETYPPCGLYRDHLASNILLLLVVSRRTILLVVMKDLF